MHLRRLEYFLVLAETGNLQRASEMLNVSPPALSKAMKLLEEEIEVPLFVRDGRRNILSDSGKALLRRAPQLVDELKRLKNNLILENEHIRPIRIGTFEVFSTYFLTFLERFNWDNHALELHELLPGEIEKYIESGEIDIGITYLPIPNPQLDFLKITAIEMGVFTRQGAFDGVEQEDLPYVVPILPLQGAPTKVRGLDGWPDDAYNRKILHRVTLLESALELCRQGRVAGYFPKFIVEEHNKRIEGQYRLERRRSPYSDRVCKNDVYIVKRKSSEENDVIKQLAKALRVICK